MAKFRSAKSLQKFTSIHSSIHNHFNQERHLYNRQIDRAIRVASDVCRLRVRVYDFRRLRLFPLTMPYVALLERLVDLELVESVAPIQLAIRLLIPQGSYLLDLSGFRDLIDAFDADSLGYPWQHRDPRVDGLQRAVQDFIERAEENGLSRRQVFAGVWNMAHEALQVSVPELPNSLGYPTPRHSEPWYCCAEPTSLQLEIV